MVNIQIIISGWHYNKYYDQNGKECINNTLIEGLKYLQNTNPHIDVFWSCHNSPIEEVKLNFKYKVFENIGLEWGAYQQALEYLNIKDPEILLFFIHDDTIIENWEFLEKCSFDILNGDFKIYGNGMNYGEYINPYNVAPCSKWLKNKQAPYIYYVSEHNKKYYKNQTMFCYSIRGSFICTKLEYLQDIGGFDYINIPQEILNKSGKFDVFGNTSLYMNAWKFTHYFGGENIGYLSLKYRKSAYINELARNKDK